MRTEGSTGLLESSGTFMLSVGSFCLNRMSQTSRTPSAFTVKNTDGLTGLQQASIRYDVWYLQQQPGRLKLQNRKLGLSPTLDCLKRTWWT